MRSVVPAQNFTHLQSVVCNFGFSEIVGGAKKGKNMNKPRDIRFSFDNIDVACRFVDAVFAIPNMGGVTIHLEDAPQEAEEEPETADNKPSTPCEHIYHTTYPSGLSECPLCHEVF